MLKQRACVMALVLLLPGCVSVAACGEQSVGGDRAKRQPSTDGASATPVASPTPQETPLAEPGREGEATMDDELKTLAEARYGNVQEAFVAVVRDAESYAALRSVITTLPEMKAESFEKHAVVAAFLGMRRTGGYGVQITRTDRKVIISESAPPKGAMTTQALTAPFKIVSVPLHEDALLSIETGAAWTNAMRPYRVKAGEFMSSGGIAGRMERFTLEGELRIARLGKLVSVAFALKSVGSARGGTLQTVATGTSQPDGGFVLPRMAGGSLVEWPNGGLRARGSFKTDEGSLSLKFESLPSKYSDGFSGAGQLEAVATAPPKRTRTDDDLPM